MGLTSSFGNRPARLHSSMMGMRLSSINLRVVSRTRRSSSVSRESNSRKSTPRNLMAMSVSFLFLRRSCFEQCGERCREGQALREWKLLKVTKGERAVKPATGGRVVVCYLNDQEASRHRVCVLIEHTLCGARRCQRPAASGRGDG